MPLSVKFKNPLLGQRPPSRKVLDLIPGNEPGDWNQISYLPENSAWTNLVSPPCTSIGASVTGTHGHGRLKPPRPPIGRPSPWLSPDQPAVSPGRSPTLLRRDMTGAPGDVMG